jgi:hypothetical protein
MEINLIQSQRALKYEVQVKANGRIEFNVPFLPGARVCVFVIEEPEETLSDLIAAAESSLAFWNNPFDDEDWNYNGPQKLDSMLRWIRMSYTET